MSDYPRTWWQRLQRRLFWLFFPEQAQMLNRYQTNLEELERWFPSHVPEVAEAASWVRYYAEPHRPINETLSGLDISRLRDRLFLSRQKPLKPREAQTVLFPRR